MKLIFNIVLILASTNLYAVSLFHITYKNNLKRAISIKNVMSKYLYLPEQRIVLMKVDTECERSKGAVFQICVLENNQFKTIDWSGNEFKAIKPMIQNINLNKFNGN